MAPPLLVVAVATLLPLLVGVTGFEPATLCSQSRCATKLRYTPMDVCPLPHHTGGDSKCRARGRLTLGSYVSPSGVRGCSSMVEPLPSKQITRVRFPSSAPQYGKPRASWPGAFFCSHPTMRLTWVRQLLNRATQNPQPKGKGVCRTDVSLPLTSELLRGSGSSGFAVII